MRIALLMFSLWSLCASAADMAYFETHADRQNKKPLATVVVNECRISDIAICRSGDCQAKQASEGKLTKSMKPSPLGKGGMNPAAVICRNMGGADVTYVDSNDNEIAVCKFKDGSFIFTWEMMKYLQKAREAGV